MRPIQDSTVNKLPAGNLGDHGSCHDTLPTSLGQQIQAEIVIAQLGVCVIVVMTSQKK